MPTERRIEDPLDRMALAEKAAQPDSVNVERDNECRVRTYEVPVAAVVDEGVTVELRRFAPADEASTERAEGEGPTETAVAFDAEAGETHRPGVE